MVYPRGARGRLLVAAFTAAVAATALASHRQNQTRVVLVTPPDGARGADVDTVVQVHFSTGLRLSTLTADSVRLLDPAGASVAVRRGSDIEGDVVNLQPQQRLAARTEFAVQVTSGLLDKNGMPVAPFSSKFTTGDAPAPVAGDGFRYGKTRIDDGVGWTAIAVGPDGNVYASNLTGVLFRIRIDPATGLSTGKETLLTLAGRRILGLAFDPSASASSLVAWITYDDRNASDVNEGTFSGVVSRVRIPATGAAAETVYVTGLPSGWHPLNGCAFGPDRRLYVSVGSMNRLGDDPVRPERPLSAAVIVADVRNAGFNGGRLPLNVQTTAPVNYDPYAATAPVKLYATGFRELYRPCWHSNGNLYGGINSNDGTTRADTPSGPGVPSLHAVFPDEPLVRIVEGGYYGHPNPSRNQIVLMGGNPTAGVDPWEMTEYPVGVQPDPAFNASNLIFNLAKINGTSANGCCEYALPGPLNGRLLICFFEGTHTIHTFAFNPGGTAVTDQRPLLGGDNTPLLFTNPLDVAVHPSARIYVADHGAWGQNPPPNGAIWMLDAVPAAAPSVSLTSPASGAAFTAPAAIVLEATASALPGRSIARVEFSADGAFLGSDATSPYTFSWNNVPQGSYVLRAKAVDDAGASALSSTVTITVQGSGGGGMGLRAETYDGLQFDRLREVRTDPKVDFVWNTAVPEDMSVIWTGEVEPLYSETTAFTTLTDDGVRLWVDGRLLIDNWIDHAPTEDVGTLDLTAGRRVSLRMEYYKSGYYGEAHLWWSSASQPREIIDQSRLHPPAAPPPGATGAGGGGRNRGGCGATGLEAGLVVAALLLARRRRRERRRT